MVTDPIADLLTRIRNAQRVGHAVVKAPASKMTRAVLEVLKGEGYIESFEEIVSDKNSSFMDISVLLKYYNDGEPCIRTARRASKPGCRYYSQVGDLPKINCGLGISIISTSQGVLSDTEARKRHVGGEVLAYIS